MPEITTLEAERTASLDDLVNEMCLTLQISPTQFDLAREHYGAVGDWLARQGSPIADLSPVIHPQGSMALRTTVRPRGHEEYDLDLVLQVVPFDSDPMRLYELVRARLAAHADYRERLQLMKRCLRLNYAGQFHLDILPARHDSERGSSCIEVPDRKLEAWKPSNPAGYIDWFERQCELAPAAKAERARVPLPGPLPDHLLRPLRRVVQLLKRRRDNRFNGDDIAPRSVVLTTLAGIHYGGQESVTDTTDSILMKVEAAIAASYPRPIEVRNPTNPDELFSEAWSDRRAYDAFAKFIRDLREELAYLRETQGLHRLGQQLDTMFGDGLGHKAVRSYTERMANAKDRGDQRFAAPGIIVGTGEGRRAAPHTFHHRA